ncbi:MAG: glycosyltransferase family 4 protein [bacterium]
MEESREGFNSTHEPVHNKLPISKKRGGYRPNTSHLTLIKSPAKEEPLPGTFKIIRKKGAERKKSRSAVKKKQRIAFFTWDHLPAVSDGPTSSSISRLSTELAKGGHEVHVFARSRKGDGTHEIVDGVHYHRISIDDSLSPAKGATVFANKILERIKRIEAKGSPFDVIHCYNWQPAKAVKNLHNGLNRRFVLTLQQQEAASQHDGEFVEQQCAAEQELIAMSDSIVCFDKGMRTGIMNRFDIPDHKLPIINEPFDWRRFQGIMDPGEIKKKYDLWPLDPLVLFVGGFDYTFGPDILADAIPAILKNTPQVRFLMVGSGDLEWTVRIKAHYLLYEHAIRMIGHKEGTELEELFQAADIVIVPSRMGINPFQVLASWGAKKPVVATHAGSCGLIRHEENGILIYDNPNSVVWGVERILFDWDKGREIAQRGWEEIQEQYTWEAIVHKIETIYQSMPGRTLKNKS